MDRRGGGRNFFGRTPHRPASQRTLICLACCTLIWIDNFVSQGALGGDDFSSYIVVVLRVRGDVGRVVYAGGRAVGGGVTAG